MNKQDTYLADYDDLTKRSTDEKILWVRNRILKIFINPIKKFISSDNHDLAIGVMTLICCGIEALGHFGKGRTDRNRFNGSDKEDFQTFIREYIPQASRISSQLYDHFRCGLAHAFAIERGDIEGDIEGLFKKVKRKQVFYKVNPWNLFKLLENGVDNYFKDLINRKRTRLRKNFTNRFDHSFKFWIENPPGKNEN